MAFPTLISFRNMTRSAPLERLVRDQANGLKKLAGDLAICAVSIDHPSRGGKPGPLFYVRVDASMAETACQVESNALERDPYLAILSAFHIAAAQIAAAG